MREDSVSISTKRGDSGETSTLSGERVPKYHLITEAVGTLDEASAMLGLSRASARERRVKRILLQVQNHLFTMGAEISMSTSGKKLRKTTTDADVRWVEGLVDRFEEALALPPGFIAFGQETSSAQMDVARTAVRKVERIAVKMKSEGLIENPALFQYLNRLSDLLFVLACFEERTRDERRAMGPAIFQSYRTDSAVRKVAVLVGSIILALIIAIILILIFHGQNPEKPVETMKGHMQEMGTTGR